MQNLDANPICTDLYYNWKKYFTFISHWFSVGFSFLPFGYKVCPQGLFQKVNNNINGFLSAVKEAKYFWKLFIVLFCNAKVV